MIKIDKMLST